MKLFKATYAKFALVLIAIFAIGTPAQAQAVRPETVASGLENPWGLAFLTGG